MSRADGGGLLAAIAASPGDDLPRLVYADWLDDHGDRLGAMRAKFIRLQIARAREGLTATPTDAEALLVKLCGRKWHPHWPAGWHKVIEYDRGFQYHVALPHEQAAGTSGEPVPLAHPEPELAAVRSVAVRPLAQFYFGIGVAFFAGVVAPLSLTHFESVGRATVSAELWAAVPKSVADLSASGSHLNEDFLDAMVAERCWPNVRRLAVSAWMPYPDAGAVLDAGAFPAVADLTFNASDDPLRVARSKLARSARRLTLPCREGGEADLLGSLFAGAAPELSELSILACDSDAPGLAQALAALPAGRLRLLAMREFNDEYVFPPADALAESLMISTGFGGLKHLDLKEYPFSPRRHARPDRSRRRRGHRAIGAAPAVCRRRLRALPGHGARPRRLRPLRGARPRRLRPTRRPPRQSRRHLVHHPRLLRRHAPLEAAVSASSEERGLLASIVADPGADLPRLVYADWLDEHDSPERAELIRVQCELARRPDRPPELVTREAELVAVGELWRVPGLSGVQHCRRGFADGIDTSADALLALPPGRLEFVPVQWLRLRVADKRIEEVARLPVWPRLTTLMLNTNNFGSASRLARFFGAADCARLTTLGLGNNVMRSYSVEELVRLPVLTQIEELILEGNPIGDDGAAILAAGPRLCRSCGG